MKIKFKLWWSTIPPISTKWTITFHLNSLNINKTTKYDTGNPGPDLGQPQICGKESLNCDGHQFHQYQQNEQSPFSSTH
jgi:hypothetical protein